MTLLEQQRCFRATHDPLTELTNRAQLVTVIERALHRGQRREQPPAIVYVILDGVMAVNGDGVHQLGDQVLRSVAQRLSDAVRPADVAARVGGDKLAVLCEDLSSSMDAEQLAVRIREAVELPVAVGDRTVDVHATTGVAFAVPGDDPESLLARALLGVYPAEHHSARRAADAGPATPSVPSSRRSPATRGSTGSALGADGALGQPLDLANWLVNRVFQISLELHVMATRDGHACALLDGVVEELDRLIADIRLAALAAHHRGESQADDPASEIARAAEALDAAFDHLGEVWNTVVTNGDAHALGSRLSHAAHLTQSASRVLRSEVLY
jgi:diguanylate cyclase (GGDEF)-like protein